MATERVVANGRQNTEQKPQSKIFDAPFLHSTISPDILPTQPTYKAARELQHVAGESRTRQLDAASRLLTKQEPFTEEDMHAFAATMFRLAGSFKVAAGEHITAVPDRIPRTGVKEITLHREITPEGKSLNVVYQTVGDQPDRRYVIGNNFGEGASLFTSTELRVGTTETAKRPFSTHQAAEDQKEYLDKNFTQDTKYLKPDKSSAIRLDHKADNEKDAEELRRNVCVDIYVAHLADAGQIERSRAAAETVRDILHQGTPVTALEPAR